MSEKIASIVVLERGQYRGEVFKSVEAAASHALNVLMQRSKNWECLHSIRDHKNNLIWKYEGGVGAAMAKLYSIIYAGERKEKKYEQDSE